MQRHQQKQHVFLIILVLLHTMVCFNLKFTYNFALLINMMLLMKKGILGCNIIYLFILICIGIALPIKSQNNYKVKLTGTVYEYDHNNKRLPLEFAAVSIPEIALGTTSDEMVDTYWKTYLLVKFVCKFNIWAKFLLTP